ncbi:MAG: DUF2867 domain-containing protein [Polyangiaceae bacterium]|jgi:hypothetical protein
MHGDAVQVVEVPAGTLAASLEFRDYVDAYGIGLDGAAFPDIDAFARAFLRPPPTWVRTLMGLRNGVAGVFGLKKVVRARRSEAPLEFSRDADVGIFRVVDRTYREIVLGQDDRHLSVRVALIYAGDVERRSAVVATLVRFHSALGRAYFLPVAPVHRRIVPAMMRNAIGRA